MQYKVRRRQRLQRKTVRQQDYKLSDHKAKKWKTLRVKALTRPVYSKYQAYYRLTLLWMKLA